MSITARHSRKLRHNWNRDHEEMLLTGLLPVACLACFFIHPRPTCSRVVPPTAAQAFPEPSHINNESRKCSKDFPTGQSDGRLAYGSVWWKYISAELLSFQMTQRLYQVDKKKNVTHAFWPFLCNSNVFEVRLGHCTWLESFSLCVGVWLMEPCVFMAPFCCR